MSELDVVVCLAFDHRAPADGVARLKQCIARCPQVDSAIEVSGSFDLIVEAHCASLADYMQDMERLRPVLADLATKVESNFVSRKVEHRRSDGDAALWLPCANGRRRVEQHMIDKVVAEGDYMRVHVGSWNCLVHQTMNRLCEQLAGASFIKLHRSCLVRVDFIDRLLHEGRRWSARLKDGAHVPIAQSSVRRVLTVTRDESSNARPGSSTNEKLTLSIG